LQREERVRLKNKTVKKLVFSKDISIVVNRITEGTSE
jgi:hypothetical protein